MSHVCLYHVAGGLTAGKAVEVHLQFSLNFQSGETLHNVNYVIKLEMDMRADLLFYYYYCIPNIKI